MRIVFVRPQSEMKTAAAHFPVMLVHRLRHSQDTNHINN